MTWIRAIVCVLSVGGGAAGAGDGPRIERVRLENGLTVFLRPTEGAPNACLLVLFGIGGDHDPAGQSGLAHLIEHVYVTAAAGPTPARTIQEYLRRYPAGWNAQTGDDYTVIAAVFPREKLEEELRDAAARMGDLRVTEADLAREIPRLTAELANMFGGMPALAARNWARERLRPTPERGRRGGVPAQVKAIALGDVRDRVRRYYKPGNARIALVGGFDVTAARAAIETHFGPLSRGELAPKRHAPGAPRAGAVESIRIDPIAGPRAVHAGLAFAAPSPGSELYAPFLILTARLQVQGRFLVPDPRAFPVQYAVLDDPAVLLITAPSKDGESSEETVRRLDTFTRDAVSAKLYARDRTAANNAFGLFLGLTPVPEMAWKANPYGMAFALARRDQLGIDPGTLKTRLAAVTADDLRGAAKTIFAPEKRAAIVVEPRAARSRFKSDS